MINVMLPTYNEAENIVPLLNMLQQTLESINKGYYIIVIDDNSPDGTAEIVKGLDIPNVFVLERSGKKGLGSAYMDGLSHCKYPYTVILDSDLQHDPSTIPLMLDIATTKRCDIVTGTRYAKGGMVCGWPFRRKLVSSIANNLAKYTIGLQATDLTGSFRLFKTEVLKRLIPLMNCKGFGFQMEIIARAECLGFKIEETPVVFYDRNAGDSKLGVSEILLYLKSLCVLYFSVN